MKFNCDIVGEKVNSFFRKIENKEKEYRQKQCDWHKRFAWLPVKVKYGDCRWLEFVESKIDFHGTNYSTHKSNYIETGSLIMGKRIYRERVK